MLVSKSKVCRLCAHICEGNCAKGELTAPDTIGECWKFRHKGDKLNLMQRSGESPPTGRLEGTWMNR